MSESLAEKIAATALERSRGLGFDLLTISASRARLYGVRIAQGVICRENVARDTREFEVWALWQNRESGFNCQTDEAQVLIERVSRLRREIEQQTPDQEFILPKVPSGALTWDLARGDFDELYGPERLYPLIEKHVARARGKGLRVTGYLDAQELDETTFATTGLCLRTRDHGITISLTVDDPKTGAVGAAVRASVHAEAQHLDRLIGDALDEAMTTCLTSDKPRALEPGDYTVVMHPQAVVDFVNTALSYGLFDRRKIDEGRTYLSGKWQGLDFPAGLRLAQSLSLPVDGAVYADLPLNHRLVPAGDLQLIEGGKVRDLHWSAYWAEKHGRAEGFGPGGSPPLSLEAAAPDAKTQSIKDLIKDTKRGIYIANTWYLRMVAEMEGVITGMTRDGLFEIRDGELAGPLLNMRWHDNPIRMLQSVSGASQERLLLGRSRLSGRGRTPLALAPALRIENFHFSSVTRF